MSSIAPFIGYHVRPAEAARVTCPPYDVLTDDDVRRIAAAVPDSFIRVIRSEVDFPKKDGAHSPKIYERARDNLRSMIARELFVPTPSECYFLYRLTREGRAQTGLIAAVSLDEYAHGRIKKHELTRVDKEEDRTRHMKAVGANTGQVFLAYESEREVDRVLADLAAGVPLVSFDADDGVRHELWVISDARDIDRVTAAFRKVNALYIADGHHRIAAAHRLLDERRKTGQPTKDTAYERVMATVFPHDQLEILPYNRIVTDLGGRSSEDVLAQVAQGFHVSPTNDPLPGRRGVFGMFAGGRWYRIEPKSPPTAAPVEKRLDVAILQDQLLRPILGIEDPRTDGRIEFLGGVHGAAGLQKRASECRDAIAFLCHPTAMEDLLAVADKGSIMPPKSTWFEPKLRSGLVIRLLG